MQMWPEPRPTCDVNPSEASIAALRDRPDENAIIMLNLLRYSPGEGRDAYARYGAAAGQVVRANGGGPVYIGSVQGSDSEWDTALLVRYPRRASYLAMQTDPLYLGAIPDRTAGLSARLLYPFHNPVGPADDPFMVRTIAPDEALVVCLSHQPVSFEGATQVLSLVGDMPMVSDSEWAALTVLRFASAEAANSSAPADDTLWLVTQPHGRP